MRRPTRLVFFLLTLSLPYTLLAQKPVPVQDQTFGLPPEKSTVQGPDGRHDARTGLPLALYQPNYRVGNGTPEENAREYLTARAGQLGLSPADLANLEVAFLRQGAAGTTVRLAQRYGGLPVHKGEIAVSYTPTGEVHYVHNNFQYDSNVPDVRPAISLSAAKGLAYRHLRLAGTISRSSEELLILPRAEGARLAYRIAVSAVTPAGDWEVFIDAKNGEVLRAQDIAVYYRNHDHDHSEPPSYTPAPMLVSGTGKVFDPDPLSSSGSVYGATGLVDGNDSNTPELLAQQFNVTLLDITFDGTNYLLKGPWAEVVELEAPAKGIFSQTSPNWTANRSDDAFEAVSVYYHIDASMRYLNETLGVTVRPRGYTTGVRVDPAAFNGADNSRYSGGCECLYFGEGGVDDAEDSDVVHHELGHGLHDWITGGNLSNNQGLSEGSGDYWAVSYNRSVTSFAPSHPSYNFVFNWDGHNPFWPGRRTDDTRIYPTQLTGGIHNDGQIWATAMIQVLDAIGKPLADRVFWEGIALTGSSSNQNDAAVAVFNASGALGYDNATRQTIHSILTARGYILPPFVALPVEWLSVAAAPQDKTIVVTWTTAAEPDNAFFTVEKSVDGGRSFQALANVPSQTSGSYAYPDLAPQAGSNTYRIRQTDHDGTFSFSQVVNVQWAVGEEWLIYPNPVADELFVQWPVTAPGQEARLRLYDINGKLLREWTAVEGQQRLPVGDLAPGVYLLESERGTQRFVKR